MSIKTLDAQERRSRHNQRPSNDAAPRIGPVPLGEADGLVDPLSWEGKAVPTRQWLVKNLIPMREVTMISGNGGDGKSLLTLQLGVAFATGGYWLGRPVQSVRVMGVYCEDAEDELHRRTFGVVSGERRNFSELEGLLLFSRKTKDNLIFQAQNFDVTGEFTPFFQRLRSTALEHGAQILILDSLYNFFGGNENSKTQVNQFVNGLAELADDINGAVIIVSHPSQAGMNTGSGTSGSTAWHNAVRSRLYLHRRQPEKWQLEKNPSAKGPLILQPMKANYGPIEDAIEIMWEQGRFVPVCDPTAAPANYRSPYGDA